MLILKGYKYLNKL